MVGSKLHTIRKNITQGKSRKHEKERKRNLREKEQPRKHGNLSAAFNTPTLKFHFTPSEKSHFFADFERLRFTFTSDT